MAKLVGTDWKTLADHIEEAAHCFSNPRERDAWLRLAEDYRRKAAGAGAAETGGREEALKPRPRFLRVRGISHERLLREQLKVPLWKLLVAPFILPLAAVFFWYLYAVPRWVFAQVVAWVVHLFTGLQASP